MAERRLFVPALAPVTAVPAVGSSKLNTVYKSMPNMVDQAVSAYQNIPEPIKQRTKDVVVSYAASKINAAIQEKKTGTKSPTKRPSSEQGNRRSGYALTEAPKPREISLNTGLQPRLRVTDYLDADLNKCSPLHMTGALFKFPTYAGSRLQSFFLNDIAFHLQVSAQNNISFNLNLTDFSTTNILNAMNDLSYALQILFYYKSIIAYADKPSNNNGGLLFMRRLITPQMLSDLYLLERRLADTPVPPNLLELLRYLSGNFAASSNVGCAILKTFPIAPSTTLIDGNVIVTALNNLCNSPNTIVYTLMRRCLPHWVPGSFSDVPVDIVHDSQFNTIFANLPVYSYYSATGVALPQVANSDSPIQYNSFTNDLDGMTVCLTSIYDLSVGLYYPGFIIPTGTIPTSTSGNSRQSYYTDGTTKQFYPSDVDPFLNRSRRETYMLNDAHSSALSPHLAGASNVVGVTANTIVEIGLKASEYLMSFEQIKVDARNYYFNASNKGNNKKWSK